MFPVLFVTLVIGFALAAIFYAVHAERQRQKAVLEAAAELGLLHTPQLAAQDNAQFENFGLSQIGHSRAAQNAIVADSGELRMVIFDYQYSTGSGKNKSTPAFSVVMATSGSLQLPQFSLTPESFFHRLADFFGFKDIDFDDDQAFSDRYLLKGENESAIRAFFTSSRRAEFLKLQNISIEGRGNTFLFCRNGKLRDLAHIRGILEESFSIYRILSDSKATA